MTGLKDISSVTVVGSGNVAEALAVAVAGTEGLELRGIAARNAARAARIAAMAGGVWSGPISDAAASDLYLIAVSDRSVAEVAAALPHRGGVAAHTAGSVAADVLRAAGWESCGVVYPFQTFTAGRRVDFSQVPLFVEGSDEARKTVRPRRRANRSRRHAAASSEPSTNSGT